MYHRNYTTYIQKELDFLKLLVTRFHEQEKINGLELDVALSKTQDIFEQLLHIKLLPEAEASAIAVAEKTTTASLQQPDSLKKEQSSKPPTVEVSTSEEIAVAKEGKISKKEPVPVNEKKNPSTVAEPAKSGILAEKISPSNFSPINETLAQQKQGNDLSSKLQTSPLSSMVAGIGLNDKFLYIRELFKGDNVLYNNTIRLLDTAESLEDAMDFIHRHFDWDQKNETAHNFISLVHRRHGG